MPDDGTNDNTQQQGQQSPANPPAFEPITSQEQLNALLGDRLARERAKFGDYNDLKAKAARLDQIEAANKSDLDKATDAASKAEQRAQAAEQRLNRTLTRQAVIGAAVDAQAIDVDAVAALVADQVVIDESGNPVGAKQAVAALAKTKPHLFRTTPAGGRDAGAGGTTPPAGQNMDDWIRSH